jgi:hypothetical protein
MIPGRHLPTRSTSSTVDPRPSENRTNELAKPLSTPIAIKTCEGVSDPAEQAEPLDAQIPSMSSPANSDMLSAPSTVNATVFESRLSRGVCD